ncbi:hypothetical protein JL722_10685 [Aureococcus anophagefferens]|nr:hypothetical protein JL722_10685 [Aureococcus anophagefferens]
MRAVSATKPHYVRCLKPNDDNVPDAFWRVRVAEQLRYGGVLEAVRVARSGFPVRMPHAEFLRHYRPLGAAFASKLDGRAACEALIAVAAANAGFAADQAQLGKTKVFLRKHAHDALETDRAAARRAAAVKCQAATRRALSAGDVLRKLAAARVLAAFGRVALALKRLAAARRTRRGSRRASSAGDARRSAASAAAWRRRRASTAGPGPRRRRRGARGARGGAAPGLGARSRSGGSVLRPSRVVAAQARARARLARAALGRLKRDRADVGRLRGEAEAMKAEIVRLQEDARRQAFEREAAAAEAAAVEVARLAAELEASKQARERELHELRQRVGEEARRREAAEAALESARPSTATLAPKIAARRQSLAKKMDGAGPGFAADWEDDDEGEEDPSSPRGAASDFAATVVVDDRARAPAQFLDKLRRGGAHVALWEDHAASGEAKPAAPLPLAALYGARRGHCGICGLADRDDGLEEARFVALLAEART